MLTSFREGDPSKIFLSDGPDLVDAWGPLTFQSLAREAGFCLASSSGDPSLLGEAKDLADRLSRVWDGSRVNLEMKTALLAALRPETFGCGQGESGGLFSLAILRQLAGLLGLSRFPQLDLLPSEKIPKRSPRYEFCGEAMRLAWGRGQGLSWAAKGLRTSKDLFSLEVQGDRGGLDGFVPGLPERPRRFLAAHMRPFSVSRKKGALSLGLRREIRLPRAPEEPKGRLQKVDWELVIRGDLAEGSLEALVAIRGLPPGQRIRLLIPVPFFPRPTRWESLEGTMEQEGPCERGGFRGPLLLQTKRVALEVSGPGWREMEILPYKNDHLLALTLHRAPREWQAPDQILRKVTLRSLDPVPESRERASR